MTIFIVLYGALSIPVYWLQGYSLVNFEALTALWILFAINTFIIIALLNIYIPYCMRKQGQQVDESEVVGACLSSLANISTTR